MSSSAAEEYSRMRDRVYGNAPQRVYDVERPTRMGDERAALELPPPLSIAVGGARWGYASDVPTVAYWASQIWYRRSEPWWAETTIRLGDSLSQEVAACLLCGYGVPSELGVAMFQRLRDRELADGTPAEAGIFAALNEPVDVGARRMRYRFPRQKSRHIAGALAHLDANALPLDLLELRRYLTALPGIGWKTASFIARNLGCDRVAVLDVHIVRGCVAIDVFSPAADVARDYPGLEHTFLEFANAIGARPSRLDAFMWSEIRSYPDVLAPRCLVEGRGFRGR